MARTADLGWAVARCDGDRLELMTPESEDDPAASLTIEGADNLMALRDLIDDALRDAADRKELDRQLLTTDPS